NDGCPRAPRPRRCGPSFSPWSTGQELSGSAPHDNDRTEGRLREACRPSAQPSLPLAGVRKASPAGHVGMPETLVRAPCPVALEDMGKVPPGSGKAPHAEPGISRRGARGAGVDCGERSRSMTTTRISPIAAVGSLLKSVRERERKGKPAP